MKPWMIELESENKQIMPGTYTRRELIEGKIELIQFDEKPRINRMNKLAGMVNKLEMVLSLDELCKCKKSRKQKS